MLGKLLKYDFKDLMKIYFPISIFLIAYSIFGALFLDYPSLISESPNKTPLIAMLKGAAIVVFVIVLIAYGVITFVLILNNFYKKMVTEQGYLTHTLPVKTSTVIFSKIISSTVLTILSAIVIFGCVCIFFNIWYFLSQTSVDIIAVINEIPGWNNIYFFIFALVIVLGIVYQITMIYLAIAFGQLFPNHKILGAIISYIGIYFVYQIVGLIFAFTVLNSSVMNAETITSMTQFHPFFIYGIVCSTVTIIIQTFLTHYLFKNKLNLQ